MFALGNDGGAFGGEEGSVTRGPVRARVRALVGDAGGGVFRIRTNDTVDTVDTVGICHSRRLNSVHCVDSVTGRLSRFIALAPSAHGVMRIRAGLTG